jgi:hypothetical protein
MNIFQKYEKQHGYPAITAIHVNTYTYESEEAVLESAALCNWLWDNFSIKIVIRFGVLSLYISTIESPSINFASSGKVLKTKQQAYVDAFETILTDYDFIQYQQTKQPL